jgi:hypothetical protein
MEQTMTPNQLAFYEQAELPELMPEPVPAAAAIELTKLRLQMAREGEEATLREAVTARNMWRDRARELEAQLESHRQIATDTYNALWAIFYPHEPESWQYPGQIVIEVRGQNAELTEANANQREIILNQQQFILELEAENRRLYGLLDEALEALAGNGR